MIQELFSPIVTPFLLCFNLRYKSLDIVDFFRNFTVDVVGVGDVCSFAQMDVKRHGNPEVSYRLEIDKRFLNVERGDSFLLLNLNFDLNVIKCLFSSLVWRRSGLMVSALVSGSSGPCSNPGRRHCAVFLGKTLHSHSAFLHPGV